MKTKYTNEQLFKVSRWFTPTDIEVMEYLVNHEIDFEFLVKDKGITFKATLQQVIFLKNSWATKGKKAIKIEEC